MNDSLENAKNIQEIAEKLSLKRQKILSILSEKKWFRKTDFDIQKKVLTLPPDFDGYLSDLAVRRDEYKGIDVLRLIDIPRGNYNLISLFEVRSQKTNEIFTYEYSSSKFGRNPGFRGILFLESNGEIKYFILRHTEKFAIGSSLFETIGGYIQFVGGKLVNMPKTVEDQLRDQLGFKEINIKRFIDLGLIATDPGSLSSRTSIFAATIDVSSAHMRRLENKIFRTKPVTFQLVVEPIERIREYVAKTDESFFLACVLRLVAQGVISL